MQRSLGVCYYPEHWPRDIWREDAARMKEAGLTYVRIGEFAWSRLEPQPGSYDFEWLDEAFDVLGEADLKIVLGTPTATPPRWLVERHPDMLGVDEAGRARSFGSRRHYCFSHSGYRGACAEIVTRLVRRYGQNRYLAAWQTDNEYGCHDTTLSWSDAARSAFRDWLRARYRGGGNDGDIEALNRAWGNVFWSMEYSSFEDIDLPNMTVTEPNPSHMLAFRRFSSDQVASFNRLQVEIIRRHSRAPITHNYMGRTTDFDHFAVGADLDFASWDSYPLGFLDDRISESTAHKRQFARQGDPDFQAFHHDLYRAVGNGRWWVMEQQPGPVNWAPHNPAPLPGMVRLWTWEAFAHGAETVCYFRWRQVPFAQEQMHAGLLRPDSTETAAIDEARQVAAEIADAPGVSAAQAPVAMIFDYDCDFAWTTQPLARELSYFQLVFDHYRALRSLGMSIDILPSDTTDFSGYRFVLAPGLVQMSEELKSALLRCDAHVLIGPRSGAKTADMQIPVPLPPAIPGMDCTVSHIETLHPDMPVPLEDGGAIIGYREFLQGDEDIVERSMDGEAVLTGNRKLFYLAACLDQEGLRRILAARLNSAGLTTLELPDGVRVRETGEERFWFNYDSQPHEINGVELAPVSFKRELRQQG